MGGVRPSPEAEGGGLWRWGDTDRELASEEADDPPRLEDACESRSSAGSRSLENACKQRHAPESPHGPDRQCVHPLIMNDLLYA